MNPTCKKLIQIKARGAEEGRGARTPSQVLLVEQLVEGQSDAGGEAQGMGAPDWRALQHVMCRGGPRTA